MEDLKKILLVDDSETQLYLTEKMLKNKYNITLAMSGKEALALLSKGFVPNLILLDIVMPEMDGWETFNLIKGISLLRNVPIAFFTSLENKTDKIHAYKLGAADFITKPCEESELIKRIESIMEKHQKTLQQDN
jgi:CheY-like chemotaxis protein